MKINSPAGNRLFIGILALLVSQFVITNCARAQTTTCRQNQVPCFGDKAVYGLVGTSVTVVPSQVWIDASAFWTPGVNPDICGIINGILTSATYPYPSTGAVIDARGLVYPGSTSGVIACSGNPFLNVTVPSTILLPAAQIPIHDTWVLPNNTKIIGEGAGTWLQATTKTNAPTGYLIEMGSSASCPSEGCSGVTIEHIQLDASNLSFSGIHNQFSQTPSYVNDIVLSNSSLIGLKVEGPGVGGPGAIDSGPYTNITFTAGASSSCTSSGCPMCVDLEAQTRGLHGITCLGNVNTAGVNPQNPGYPAIMVNASNNSIDDVHVESFWDGIEVGNTTSQVGNIIISNITGSSTGGCQQDCPTTNTVHICGIHPNGTFGKCSINYSGSTNTVSDVTILQTAVTLNEDAFPATAVEDDVTGTSIVHCASCDILSATAMYVLGEPVQISSSAIGYSRVATALGPGTNNPGGTVVPTWGVGTTAASGGTCNTPGALYSNSGASGGLFVCAGNPNTWQLIAP
jgi:hypothetical protein